MMILVAIMALVALFIVAAVNRRTIQEKNILLEDNARLERTKQLNDSVLASRSKTLQEQTDTLRAVVTECHGVIGACLDEPDQAAEQERSLAAILTECHATIGNDVSDCFDELRASEQQHYAKVRYPDHHVAPWSIVSALQAKHAAEKKLRKATNEPGFHKFTDNELFEPAEVVEFHTVPRFEVSRDDVDSSEQNFI